jgi:hypothetical protein
VLFLLERDRVSVGNLCGLVFLFGLSLGLFLFLSLGFSIFGITFFLVFSFGFIFSLVLFVFSFGFILGLVLLVFTLLVIFFFIFRFLLFFLGFNFFNLSFSDLSRYLSELQDVRSVEFKAEGDFRLSGVLLNGHSVGGDLSELIESVSGEQLSGFSAIGKGLKSLDLDLHALIVAELDSLFLAQVILLVVVESDGLLV